jgi:hypothetical protein
MTAKSIARYALRCAVNQKSEWARSCRKEANILKAVKSGLFYVTEQVLDCIGTNDTDLDKPRVYVYYGVSGNARPQIYFSISGADGFKDDSLMMAMQSLLETGFESSPKQYESAEFLRRTYTFKRSDMDVEFDVQVKDDSPTCRRVVIGQETIVKEKYKIECD